MNLESLKNIFHKLPLTNFNVNNMLQFVTDNNLNITDLLVNDSITNQDFILSLIDYFAQKHNNDNINEYKKIINQLICFNNQEFEKKIIEQLNKTLRGIKLLPSNPDFINKDTIKTIVINNNTKRIKELIQKKPNIKNEILEVIEEISTERSYHSFFSLRFIQDLEKEGFSFSYKIVRGLVFNSQNFENTDTLFKYINKYKKDFKADELDEIIEKLLETNDDYYHDKRYFVVDLPLLMEDINNKQKFFEQKFISSYVSFIMATIKFKTSPRVAHFLNNNNNYDLIMKQLDDFFTKNKLIFINKKNIYGNDSRTIKNFFTISNLFPNSIEYTTAKEQISVVFDQLFKFKQSDTNSFFSGNHSNITNTTVKKIILELFFEKKYSTPTDNPTDSFYRNAFFSILGYRKNDIKNPITFLEENPEIIEIIKQYPDSIDCFLKDVFPKNVKAEDIINFTLTLPNKNKSNKAIKI